MNWIIPTLFLSASLMTPTFAEEVKLGDAEIAALLPTIIASGDKTRQIFSAHGATTYTDRGRDTYGSWRADKGQYCSQWPPADAWACYDVLYDKAGSKLIWVDGGGHRTVNLVVSKN